MKTVDIKGKLYVPVSERLKEFRKEYPNHSLRSEVIEYNQAEIAEFETRSSKTTQSSSCGDDGDKDSRISESQTVLKGKNANILIKAIISDPDGKIIAEGLAYEEEGSTYINKTSFVENCETSAWGRALGNFGIGIDASVASADEVANAIKNQ